MISMCEASRRNGTQCPNASKYVVNGRIREAQSSVCGTHLASTVAELATLNDPQYKRRHPDDKFAGTVFLINREA